MKKIHLEAGHHSSACGRRFFGLQVLFLWFDRRRVTCKSCRATKR